MEGEKQLNQKEQAHLMLVDGMALLFRAFFATAVTGQFMINSKGQPTNAIHGFVKHFFTAIDHFNPTHVTVCWDMGSTTFRTSMYDQYKANRQDAPLELIPQFELVKEVVTSFGVPNIGLSGFEADDCIGTIAKKMKEQANVTILTGDQDILQLLDNHISVAILKKGYGNYLVHTPTSFLEEKGITAKQMIDLKALMGDPSDNYPGVKGIGEKTALKLLQAHQDIEGILENLSLLTKGQQSKIATDLEMLHLCRQLAEIKCDVPLEYLLETSLFEIDATKAKEKFVELEFKNFNHYVEKQEKLSLI